MSCATLRRSTALLLVAALLATLSALAAPAPAAGEALFEARLAEVGQGEWAAYSFDVVQGALYEIRLQPLSDDVDIHLMRAGERVAAGIAGGLAAERVRWRADETGQVVAWVLGLGKATQYEIAITRVPEGPARRVGLQVGHWRNWEAGYPLSANSGASGGGKTEAEVNLAIAQETAKLLRQMGYAVDILPTVIPKGYTADAVVAIHADGSSNPSRRGFFTDRPATSQAAAAEAVLARLIDEEYAAATGLTYVYRGTVNSRYYYGYSRVAPKTPMVLIETGFLSSPADREVIVGRPDLCARGIANGIDRFLRR